MSTLAHRIVNRMLIDLGNRKGFDNLMDSLGQGIKDEIRNEWIDIVEAIIESDKSS